MADWTPAPGDRVFVGDGERAHQLVECWKGHPGQVGVVRCHWYPRRVAPAPADAPLCKRCWSARRETS